ncbi:Rrf2 family transcriptional regulator [Phaeobacter sp. J2-8]|uniref:Rrf2 family transcriptional regulator n=1 Tax=Phaeobacter sp. J2-8 TaxID=2931394 RepID=UPI001FD1C969|nr:Rrf2 family transcriptional regulator [Phaeobacter sp. J2-8]MCJ7873934.1 Rrf2 family transcriptional regulator [Phaeobacter sp. J2-8]
MRRLSDGVETALHCMLLLTGVDKDRALPGKSLAEFHGVSESYLLKHMRLLAARGVVAAIPGPRGGYRLARPAGDITLLDIVEAIDGPGPSFVCREIRQRGCGKSADPCAYKSDCFIKSRMLSAEAVWRDALRAQSLADLVADGETMIDPAGQETITAFLQREQR